MARVQKKGSVAIVTFHNIPGFSNVKTMIILPAEVSGITKNFLFDTGAQASLIQRDSIKGKTAKIVGATHERMKLGK